VVYHGALYHIKELKSDSKPIARIMIPSEMIPEMLFWCHGHPTSGHPGHKKALKRVEKFAVWPTMIKDLKRHVTTCAECQNVRPTQAKVAPLVPQEASGPLEYVQTDLLNCPESKGYKYIYVIEDRFTKYTCLTPLMDAKATGVATAIENYVTRFRCPVRWITDGGPEFYNVLVLPMSNVFQTKKEFTLAYRPQSSGQTERKNRTIKAELTNRCLQLEKNWAPYLKWIEFAYNTTLHSAHGYTPHFLMFGQ
jgi:hypothetical protein